MAAYRSRSGARRGRRWLSCLAAGAAWAALHLPPPLLAQQEAREWEVYTPTGVERRGYPTPTTVKVGLPEPVEVPSAVTGTGQGKRLTDVEVVVSEGMGGRPAAGPAGEKVNGLAEDAAGNLWVATTVGLSRFDGTNWTTFTEEDGLPGNALVDIVTDAQGSLWTVGAGGMARFDGQRWMQYRVADGGGPVAPAPNGDLWFAGGGRRARGGPQPDPLLYRFDGRDWWEYSSADGIPSPGGTQTVAVDSNGVVWTGIFHSMEGFELPPSRYELTSFDGRQWVSYSIPDTSTYESISSIHVSSRNDVWVGTYAGLAIFDHSTWRYYEGLPWAGLLTMAEDGAGRYWLGGGGGFGLLADRTWTSLPYELSQFAPRVMLLDRRGTLWMATAVHGRGVFRWPRELRPTAIEGSPGPPQGSSLRLQPNRPNPFNQETEIAFSLPAGQGVSLRIVDLSGQRVATLAQGLQGPGRYQLTWDGCDSSGQRVASGVYLCQLTAPGQHTSRKLVVVR
ncbi:MAG: FlgD immunoglobulin-like domain containing protein [Candidatus Latescibacterota bacterium]